MTRTLAVLFVLSALVASGCGSSPAAPASDPRVSGTVPAPGLPTTRVRFFGVVTTEDGAPLPGAMVAVTYVPDSGSTQLPTAQTGGDGRYELQFDARQPGNVNALIRAIAGGDYLPNEQLVRMAD